MSKIVIIGTSGSGKTCYFYGMLHKMQRGISGFSLRINDSDAYRKLRKGILSLGDARLPMDERWPDPSDKLEKYNLDLLHNMHKLDSLEWVDYPGEHVSDAEDAFIKLLDGANCLFVCVDGRLVQGDEDELDDIADDFYNESGMDICNALQRAEEKSGAAFPPVCILITKYDEVSPELQNTDLITQFVKKCFPILFHKGSGKDRMVTICPVSLGKDIAEGGKLRPKNVERPICFAAYLVQYALFKEMEAKAKGLISESEEKIKRYNNKGFFRKLVTPRPSGLSEEQKQAIAELINNSERDLDDLRAMVNVLPLFINGEETNWPD